VWSGYSHCSLTVVKVVFESSIKSVSYIFALKTVRMKGPVYEKGIVMVVFSLVQISSVEPNGSLLK
jgi:hypothetical protein